MQKMERWITEHRRDPRQSRLRRMVPSIGSFFTPIKLVEAFQEYDEFFALSRRQYVPPNFAEIRHILNIAQVGGRGGGQERWDEGWTAGARRGWARCAEQDRAEQGQRCGPVHSSQATAGCMRQLATHTWPGLAALAGARLGRVTAADHL